MSILDKNNQEIKPPWRKRVSKRIGTWFSEHKLQLWLLVISTALWLLVWYMLFIWLEAEMLKIQFDDVPSPVQRVKVIKEVKAAEITITPVATIVTAIHGLESTWGKNDGCKRKGLVNGYGYRQNSREFKCFETDAEVQALVVAWVEDKRAKGMSDAELLCYYNTGKATSDCTYYQHYLALKK